MHIQLRHDWGPRRLSTGVPHGRNYSSDFERRPKISRELFRIVALFIWGVAELAVHGLSSIVLRSI